jgi:hypothetical protein
MTKFSDGREFLVLTCQACETSFSLAAAVGTSVEKLPDPFEAKCTHCEGKSTYPKSSIRIQRNPP